MKPTHFQIRPHKVKISILTLLAAGACVPASQAAWDSVRGNNREHFEHPREVGPREVRPEVRFHHDLDLDVDRLGFHFWAGVHPGLRFDVLPPGCINIVVGGAPFFYYQGVYYQGGPGSYVVAPPPIGAVVPALPPGATPVNVNGGVFYYAGGAFYAQQPNGYAVVAPPAGATIPMLPPGAAAVTINGATYYQAGGVYYMPVFQGGATVYSIVPPPP
jgi:hypothetical protein